MLKESVIRCFNKGAETYDVFASVQKKIANLLAERITTIPDTILEIGCGTGYFSQLLLNIFPKAALLLTDIAPAMISHCQNRFSNLPHVTYACMDGENLSSLPQFDLITSSMSLHWFADFKKSVENIMTYVAPGGEFVFSMLGENSLQEWRDLCKAHQLSIPTPIFPSAVAIKNRLPELNIYVETLSFTYQNLYDFLNHLKKIGATATRAGHIPFATKTLRQLLKVANTTKHITYEVIYGQYSKS